MNQWVLFVSCSYSDNKYWNYFHKSERRARFWEVILQKGQDHLAFREKNHGKGKQDDQMPLVAEREVFIYWKSKF